MNNVGFFQWLRDSVRRTVLLGFSDALEQLGAPADGKEMNPHLLSALRQQTAAAVEHQPSLAPRSEGRTERKRLGRSLERAARAWRQAGHVIRHSSVVFPCTAVTSSGHWLGRAGTTISAHRQPRSLPRHRFVAVRCETATPHRFALRTPGERQLSG